MTLFRPDERIDLCLLDGDNQFRFDRIIELYDALILIAGMIFCPQIGNSGVADLPLGKLYVVTIYLICRSTEMMYFC